MGKPYNAKDVWTRDVSAKGWEKILKDYDYVLLGRADKIFWDRFGELFDNRDAAGEELLFKVAVVNGRVRLRPLSTAQTGESPAPARADDAAEPSADHQ